MENRPHSLLSLWTATRVKSLCLTLIGLGLAVSGYLLFRHLALADHSARAGTEFCAALFGMGCDEALQSPLAVQLGLPLAGWGLVYYGTLVSLLLLGWTVGDAFRFEATLAALALSLLAALASIALFVTMATDISPFCPLCAVVHAVNVVLVFPLKRLTGRSIGQLLGALVIGGKYLLGGKTDDSALARWKFVGFLAAGLVAVVLYQWVFVEVALHARPNTTSFDPEQTLALFESVLPQDIPVAPDDPQLGQSDATAQLVVFSDFQCPGCTQFSHTMAGLVIRFGDTLRVVFKHYPLGIACNDLIRVDLHPRACEAAWATEAARRQGKFWDLHNSLFKANLSTSKVTMESVAEQLGLDLERFEADRRREEVLEKVKSDVDMGIRLGVEGTPTVFLNGRRVYDIRAESLGFLIAHELEEGSP